MNQWINYCKKQILEKIGEEEIFRKYLERDPTSSAPVTNPLRNDKHPGCSFSRSQKTGRLYFYDYAAEKTYDCFSVVMEKYGVDFWNAIRIIQKDFHFSFLSSNKQKPVEITPQRINNRVLTYELKKFSDEELEYWEQLGIDEKDLLQYGVLSVSKVYVNDKLRWDCSEYPIFAIEYEPGRAKFYRPTAPKDAGKWLSSSTKEDIAFATKIPFLGEMCIITKSFKDALLLNVLGFPAVAPNSETVSLTNSMSIKAIQMTYDKVVIFYDNDAPGINSAKLRTTELGCDSIIIPISYGTKDISDFYIKYGKEETIKIMNKLLSNE